MNALQAIVYGLIQGLTEFLPISSSAHLRVIPAFLGWGDPGAAFTAVIQLGTLVAVVLYFWQDIVRMNAAFWWGLLRGKPTGSENAKLAWMVILGTVPIVVVGYLAKERIETDFRSLYLVAGMLAGFAGLLWLAEWVVAKRGDSGRGISQIIWRDVWIIGVAQALALIPGVSRSGVTIMAGLFLHLDRATAARFSFLLSLPSVFAAGVLQLYKARGELFASWEQTAYLTLASIVAGVVGYFSIVFLMLYLRMYTTHVFIWYRLGLAAFIFAALYAGRIA